MTPEKVREALQKLEMGIHMHAEDRSYTGMQKAGAPPPKRP